MLKNVKLPERTGDANRDITALWEFLYKHVSEVSGQLNVKRVGCKRETIKFSSGRGIIICEGVVPSSAVAATRNGGGGSGTYYVRSAVCTEPGAIKILLSENYSGIADISVFWSKEANGNV